MVAGHLQIKKGYYYAVLNLKDASGKRKPKWIPTGIAVKGQKNERLANDKLLDLRCSYKSSAPADAEIEKMRMSGEMLFADYMIRWLEIVRNTVEEVSYAGYKRNVEKVIEPYFRARGITLDALTALDVEEFYTYCLNKTKVSKSTVKHYHANIHSALRYAARHDLVSVDPMVKVTPPKADAYVADFYTISEVEALFSVAEGDPAEFPILMAAFYGLRRSEIMGLRWQAIDFESNTITIRHTVVQYNMDGHTKVQEKDRAKTKSSYRSLPLVPQYRDLLLRMRERQENCRKLCGNCYIESDYIYVNDLGERYSPNYVTQHFPSLLEKNGLRRIRFHDLRHTCASLLLKNGVLMKDIQEWLGHSDFSTTANIYAHLDTTSKDNSAAKMDQIICIAPGIRTEI